MTYDITVITENEKSVSHVLKHIEDGGGVVKKRIDLGARPFAYPIKKQMEGIYTAFLVDVPADALGQLNRELTLDTTVIRHLIVSSDNEMSTYQPPKAPELHDEHPPVADHPAPETPKTLPKTPKKPIVVKTKEETKQESQERQKVLDEKLAQILDEK